MLVRNDKKLIETMRHLDFQSSLFVSLLALPMLVSCERLNGEKYEEKSLMIICVHKILSSAPSN
jgi:hypothetical protein